MIVWVAVLATATASGAASLWSAGIQLSGYPVDMPAKPRLALARVLSEVTLRVGDQVGVGSFLCRVSSSRACRSAADPGMKLPIKPLGPKS